MENEKLQELSIVVQDRVRSVSKKWWYALLITLVLLIPLYFVLKTYFVSLIVKNHKFPAYIYTVEEKKPLEIIDKRVFKLSEGMYSGFIKVKNINLEYGLATQNFDVVAYSAGGTKLNSVKLSGFILPSSEKIILIPKFQADKDPTQLEINIEESNFTRVSKQQPNFEIQRVSMQNVDNQFIVSAGIKNNTPFTIQRVGLPILLYDAGNKIVGVNYTFISDLQYQETRTFQFTWPVNPGAVRAEVLPEVNTFDPNIFVLPPGQSQFDDFESQEDFPNP